MEPVTLVLDSATARAVCGVVLAGQELAFASAEGGHAAQRALVLVDEVLARAGREASDVGQIVVGCGPGSFTGLRIGIASARGLALALGSAVRRRLDPGGARGRRTGSRCPDRCAPGRVVRAGLRRRARRRAAGGRGRETGARHAVRG